jgi:uncharacterized damage-inducible protein DinB
MNQKIQSLWSKLEQNRLDLFQFLEKQDPSVFNRKPAPEKWSVNQNLLHLIEAETASLQYMRKKLSFGTDLPQAGFKSGVRRFLLWVAFALPTLKFKAPENLAQLPDDLNFEDLKQRWTVLRKEYAVFLIDLPENLLTAELWRHQIAGKMNITQMIGFFEDHVNRHRGQMEQALKTGV